MAMRCSPPVPGNEEKNKGLLALSFLLLALALGSLLAPFIVAQSVALWLRYEARRSGLVITMGEIRAPFLRPVEIRGLRVSRAGLNGAHFEMDAPRAEAAFHLAALLGRSDRARPVQSLRIEHATIVLRGRALPGAAEVDWRRFGALLPEQFDFSADQVLLEQSLSRTELHDAHITGAAGKSGALAIGSVELRAPQLQKTFADLHGVTRWQDSRLTIGSVRLLDGVSIDSFALDLTRLRAARIAAEIAATVFAGNVRANLATERSGNTRVWELAGSASGISLPQLAGAFGLTEPVNGLVRAVKFSFRGDPRDLLHATGSLWGELTGFSWRERQADSVMIGANYYERTIQLQQFYIKQRANELTLSGETAVGADWLRPDFRGDIYGSINDLGQFAELFGARPNSFGGKISIRGRVHAHQRKLDGELALTGDALKLFRAPVDSITARFTLDSPRVHLDEFAIKRGEDFVRGSGQVDFSRTRAFTFSGDSWCHDLRPYDVRAPLLGLLTGTCFAQVDASGDETSAAVSLAAQFDDWRMSAKGTARENSGKIDGLTVTMNGVTARLTGAVNFADRRNVTVTLTPADELRLATTLDGTRCLRGFELRAGAAGTPLSQMAITQHQLAINDGTASESVPLCADDDDSAAQRLEVNLVSPPTTPQPSP
jgi:hypothetical protein